MKNRRVKGYISVLLLICVSIISIAISYLGISSYQNGLILRNEEYNIQSKYISESYLYYVISGLDDKEKELGDNLFPDLNHSKNITKSDITFGNIPSEKIIVKSEYESVESNAKGIISKYNKIFYKEDAIINRNNLPKSYIKAFDFFKNSFEKGIQYDSNLNTIQLNENVYIGSKGVMPSLLLKNEENPIVLQPIRESNHYEFLGHTSIGDEHEYLGNVWLQGTFYIDGSINLNTNLTLNGIVISNSGSIINNGYTCQINGILIEIGNGGSYAQSIIKYDVKNINVFIRFLTNAKYREILGISINSE